MSAVAPARRPGGAAAHARAGAVLLAGLLLTACAGAPAAPVAAGGPPVSHAPVSTQAPMAPGETVFPAADRSPVPDLAGRTLAGTPLRLRDVTGKGVVVVNVWASWCAPCREESAVLAAVAAQLRDDDVRFVGLDEQDPPASARRFADAAGTDYPHLVDSDGALLSRLSVLPTTGIPSTLLIDGRGAMAARVVGAVTRASLLALIAAVTAGGPEPGSGSATDTDGPG
ncbi:MAG TPA: TlpA disulfide reductase family protein [Blastococcus sp.]|nr:TlpA disulfide reductase family protein [Blastococcus sp.]